MTHGELKHTALQKPAVHAAYEALGPAFEIWRQMLQARQDAGLTQTQIAERMDGYKAACCDAVRIVTE
jgi:hypothetical protein